PFGRTLPALRRLERFTCADEYDAHLDVRARATLGKVVDEHEIEQLTGPVDDVALPQRPVLHASVVDARRREGPLGAAGVLLRDVAILKIAKLQHRRLEQLGDVETKVGGAPRIVDGSGPVLRLPWKFPEHVPGAMQ